MNSSLDDIIDFRQFFLKLLKNWHLFVVVLLLAFFIAYGYNRYTTEFFKVAIDNLKDRKKMTTGLTVLQATDIAECILFAIKAPAHVNVSMIEVTPTEQSPGEIIIKKIEN